MTYLTIKDAGGTIRNILAQIYSGSTYLFGHFQAAVTEGGATAYTNIDVGTTGAVVKASAGQVYGGLAWNLYGATPSGLPTLYLKFYNKATAASSSDTPVLVIPLESGEPVPLGEIFSSCGVAFSAGIGVRCCMGLANADNTAAPANSCVVSLAYA